MKKITLGNALLIAALVVAGCGVPPEESVGLQQGESVATDSTGSNKTLPTEPDTQRSCRPCYVKCSNATPSACRWTRAYNIGNEANCGAAGDAWCANRGYSHSYADCSPAGATYPGC